MRLDIQIYPSVDPNNLYYKIKYNAYKKIYFIPKFIIV